VPRRLIAALLAGVALLAGLAAALYLLLLRQHPDPPGVTGYYYLKQIEVLATGGGFFFEDHSLAFLPAAAIAWLTGSALEGYRLAVALTWSALALGVAFLARALAARLGATTREAVIAAAAALLGAAASATLLEVALNYYKNLFGVTLLVWAAVAGMGPLFARRAGKVLTALLVAAALLSHKSVFLLVGLFAAAAALTHLSRRSLLLLLGGGALLLLLFWALFARAQHVLLALLGSFDGPGGWAHWMGAVARLDPALLLTVGGGLLALVLYALARRRLEPPVRVLFDAAGLFLLLCLHPFQLAGTSAAAYRMLLLIPAVALPLCLTCARLSRPLLAGAAAVCLALLCQPLLAGGRAESHFSGWSRLDDAIMVIRNHVRPGDYLISHHGMESYIGYRTGIRSKQFLPDRPRERVFRVAYVPEGRPGGEARDELEMVKLAQIGADYALLRERDWQELATRFAIRAHWRNPNRRRPAHVHE
jgi:hypothetical protein